MAKNLFITATEARSGKSAVCLGVMEMLLRHVAKVAFFRPVIYVDTASDAYIDPDINLIATTYKLGPSYMDMYAYTTTQANDLISLGKSEDLIEGVVAKYKALEKDHDFVLCEGTDFSGATSAFEFDLNAEIANNLGCPVMLVAKAHNKTVDAAIQSIEMAVDSLLDEGCDVIATVVNRVNTDDTVSIVERLKKKPWAAEQLIFAIPDEKSLGNPTMAEIAKLLNAKVLYGEKELDRHVHSFAVAAMQLRNFLERIDHGTLVITPGDRADVIVACLASATSVSMPKIAGLLLTGGLRPEPSIRRLIEGFPYALPILSVEHDTFPSARKADNVHAGISPENTRKITRALEVFEEHVDTGALARKILEKETYIVTPKMFEYGLIQKAKACKKHIVLPEGEEERILRAAEILLRREVVDITLVGLETEIRKRIARLGLRMEDVRIVDLYQNPYVDDFVETYFELRKHKGITREIARDMISDANYFGTMMVAKGHADGMVSGAVHTTGDTIRPAFEIIKTEPGISIVSSVFFMCLKDRVLVYGDCAVNPDPNAEQLAQIALSSSRTAKTFGIEPRVAMLSYSTGASGKGEDVDKVREATRIATEMIKEMGLDAIIEGPMQYDAAVDPSVARTKMPDSKVAGRATVFIFPDLNTGNNTYKAVQRSANAVAVGPVLQGLKRPVNDLSRGCTVPDIVNTVAITAVQAQAQQGGSGEGPGH
ncbi:MAG: phosphate acetyltransferase [Deltaproteobacteria bacterium]|nr:phosphate acetyltransferase [Deltaproteobacteria bacterium]